MNTNVIDGTALAGIRVDRRLIERLCRRGLVSAAARDEALAVSEPPRRWGVWVSRLLVVLGTALVLAGLVYFFAFNWNRIPPLVKLGAIATMIAAASVTVAVVGFGRLVSDAAASAAVVLVGVHLAVEGQIHQTGADAWQLFAAWAGLTLPWALVSGSAATWTIWLAVADVAVVTWWSQTQPGDGSLHAGRDLSLMVLHGVFLAAREGLAARGHRFAAPRWTRLVAALPLVAVATVAAFTLIGTSRDFDAAGRVAVVAVPAAFAALFVVYRAVLADVAVLAATTIGACAAADFALFRLVVDDRSRPELGIWFGMGVATLVLFAAAVAWLRAAQQAMEART